MSGSTLILEDLYRNHHNWLHQFLTRKLNCCTQAADIAQDTFIRLLSKQDQRTITSIKQPKAYLTTIATGLVKNHWRRKDLEQAYLESLADCRELSPYNPELQTEILDTLEQLSAILDSLPERSKEVFVLARIDGMSYKEIANKLSVTVNMVQKAMTQAMLICYTQLYD